MKTPLPHLFRLLPLLLLAAHPAQAAFSQQEQHISLTPGQTHTTVIFHTEDGSTITKAAPECTCTTVQLQGTRLIAHVDTSGFDAPVSKTITAHTSDGKRTTLTMRFHVPPVIIINTPSLVWERGSAPTPQEFRIQLPKNSPIRALISADMAGDDFDYTPRTITPGREYAISVTPRSTDHRCMNRLVLKMEGPAPHSQRILYLRVR